MKPRKTEITDKLRQEINKVQPFNDQGFDFYTMFGLKIWKGKERKGIVFFVWIVKSEWKGKEKEGKGRKKMWAFY